MNKQTNNQAEKLSGFFGTIERVGNKIPNPCILFLWLTGIVFLLSLIMSKAGVTAVNPATNEVITIVNMLASDKVAVFLQSMGKTFMTFGPMIVVPLCSLGMAVSIHSGFFNAFIKVVSGVKSKFWLTFFIGFIGVSANILGDSIFMIYPPLVALLFAGLRRNPLAGLLYGFCSISVGFGANVLISNSDMNLSALTETAAQLVDPTFVGNAAMAYYFLLASAILMPIVLTIVQLKIVEPQIERMGLGANAPISMNTEQLHLSETERKGLKAVLIAAILFVAVIVLCCQKGFPFAPPEGGSFLQGMLLKCITALIALLFFTLGFVYGKVTGSIKKFGDVIPMMQKELAALASFMVICFFAAQFSYVFSNSNIGTWIAIAGSNWLLSINVSKIFVIVAFTLVAALINIFIASAASKWALISSIFVPMFMLMGINPAVTQAAYRIGDSVTNNLTPVFAFTAILISMASEYDSRAKTGTVMALMMPYSVIGYVVWVAFIVIWLLLGLPMGPGYAPFL